MTHLQIFELTLAIIDKVKAPVLYIEVFNDLVNMAIQNVVNRAYKISDDDRQPYILQDEADGIQVLEKPFSYFVGGLGVFGLQKDENDLPDDYYHLRACIAVFKPVKGKSRYPDVYRIKSRCHRMTANIYASSVDDYYQKAKLKQVYAQVANNKLRVYYGKPTTMELERLDGFYVRKFAPIALEEDQATLDIVASSNIKSEFPDEICREIAQETAKLYLDITQNPRLRNQFALNQK